MNRGDLVETLTAKNGLTKTEANAILDTVIDSVKTGVRKDGEVRLVGFGTFKKAERKARRGVNPRTGAALRIPKKTVAKFTPSKTWEVNKATKKKVVKVKATTTKTVAKVKATTTKTVAKVAKKTAKPIVKKTTGKTVKTAAKRTTKAVKTPVKRTRK